MITGYTTGVYDLFHVGHVNLLRNAKSLCDKLIVGVTVDELVMYKNKQSVIPFHERMEVVKSCKYVDLVLPQNSIDKVESVKKLKASKLFVGDDWYGNDRWKLMEEELKEINCEVIYFPYTKGTTSSLINSTLDNLRLNKQEKL
jgi:glycerol-3-phosphate cytidylyltransferase